MSNKTRTLAYMLAMMGAAGEGFRSSSVGGCNYPSDVEGRRREASANGWSSADVKIQWHELP